MCAPPAVDVVIVSHNGSTLLDQAISSIMDSRAVHPHVIVVDNASSEPTALPSPSAGVSVLRLPTNLGYGAALNVGIANARAPWVACANQDVQVDPDALSIVLRELTAWELQTGRTCIGGPRLRTPDGATAETGHRFPSFRDQILAFLAGEASASYRNVLADTAVTRSCDWLSAAFIVGRTDSFRSVGGFDQSFFMYVEDLDFFDRLADAGSRCIWIPSAEVVHSGGNTRIPDPAVYARCLSNWSLYFSRKRGRWAGRTMLTAAVVGSLLRSTQWRIRARHGDPTARELSQMFLRASILAARPKAIADTWRRSYAPDLGFGSPLGSDAG